VGSEDLARQPSASAGRSKDPSADIYVVTFTLDDL
jgi:hypothetical protein